MKDHLPQVWERGLLLPTRQGPLIGWSTNWSRYTFTLFFLVACNVYPKPCTEFMCSSLADKPHLKSCMCELSALVGALVHGSLASGTHCIIDHDWDRLEMMDQFFQPQKMKFSSRW